MNLITSKNLSFKNNLPVRTEQNPKTATFRDYVNTPNLPQLPIDRGNIERMLVDYSSVPCVPHVPVVRVIGTVESRIRKDQQTPLTDSLNTFLNAL